VEEQKESITEITIQHPKGYRDIKQTLKKKLENETHKPKDPEMKMVETFKTSNV